MSWKSQVKLHLPDFLALCGLLGLIALLTVVLLTTLTLTESGPLSARDHTALVLEVTVAATLFSSAIASRVHHLLLRSFDKELRNSFNLSVTANISDTRLARLDRKWRGILSIDSASEKLHNLPIILVYLICALMTTATLTTFTPATFIRKVQYHPLMPDANYEVDQTCASMVDGTFNDNDHIVGAYQMGVISSFPPMPADVQLVML